jgi:FixJ family two-component response regulator
MVFIDDDDTFLSALKILLEYRGLFVDTYTDPNDFLNSLNKYAKDTKVITDYELKCDIDGLDLLKKLYELGYTKLYLMSGRSFTQDNIPHYVNVMLKDINNIENLF